MMDFDEWWTAYGYAQYFGNRNHARAAWDYQQQRIEALEAAALKVVETSGQVDHSGIYAYEMDYRRAIQRLAALLPGRDE